MKSINDPGPLSKLLRAFAVSEKPLNKYQLQKATKLGRQTVYNYLKPLKVQGWVEVISTGRSRVGLPVEFYKLTARGMFEAATRNPDLAASLRSRLGKRFEAYQENLTRNRTVVLQQLFKTVEEVLSRGTAPPNWKLELTLHADKFGRVNCKYNIGID